MVCVPCFVVPVVLWIFHRFLQPYILKLWAWWTGKSLTQNEEYTKVTFTEDMLKTEEGKFIQKNIMNHPVIVFTKKTCSFCKMACKVLDETDVNYHNEEIQDRPDCAKVQDLFEKLTGQRTVPRVFIGEKCLGGGSEIYTLHNKGGLVPLMQEAGATFKSKKTE